MSCAAQAEEQDETVARGARLAQDPIEDPHILALILRLRDEGPSL
jgi:hypothetical protein